MNSLTNFIFILLVTLTMSAGQISYAESVKPPSDDYIKGYLESIFFHSYGIGKDALTVKDGVVTVHDSKIDGNNHEQILQKVTHAVREIKGIKGVRWEGKNQQGFIKNEGSENNDYIDISMPSKSLFEPLIADPKWPRFTLAYQHFKKDGAIRRGFAPNFGASFPIYRIENINNGSKWEIGVQGGLFALMDISHNPSSLVNADYYISVPITYRAGAWSGLVRGYHLSSHLGDEFMLTKEGKKTKRINLSYEGMDALLSYNFNNFRLYGGGGYLLNVDPSYIKRLKAQGGIEYYSSTTYFNARLRPVLGLDIKADENGKWFPGKSLKAGFQLENSSLISSKIQLMLEYYSGKSFHGQFYKDKIQYIGLGLQAFL